jgi:hypothetical protein
LKVSCQLYKNSKSNALQQENKEIFLSKNNYNYNQNQNQKNSLSNININPSNTNDFLQEDNENNSENFTAINNHIINQQKNSSNLLNNNNNENPNSQFDNITINKNQQLDELNYEELKMDFEDILVLHLKVSHLVPLVIINKIK